MSKNNENNPSSVTVRLGSTNTGGQTNITHFAKKSKITSIVLIDAKGLESSDTRYAVVKVKNGDKVIATLDTRAGEGKQGPIQPNSAKQLMMVQGQDVQPAKSDISVEAELEGDAVLTDAVLVMTFHPL